MGDEYSNLGVTEVEYIIDKKSRNKRKLIQYVMNHDDEDKFPN
jgi:hypothetical protein